MRPILSRFTGSKITTSAVVVLGASVLAACTSSSASGGTTPTQRFDAPITIGASLSLDRSPRDFSADGQAFQKGYKLWAKDVNAHGGLLGRQVKLTILDDASSPNQVVTNYQTLFGKDHVDLAFGPFSSLLTAPASSVAARYGMAFVEGAGGAPSVFDTPSNQADHNVFDVSLPIADEMIPFVNWIASLPPSERPKTAAYPMAQDPFADPPVQLAQTVLQKLGVQTVYSKIFPEEVADYKAPGRPGGRDRRAARGARVHRRADRRRLHAGVRAAALHAQAVHRGGRARPGRRVHVRGRHGQRRRDDGAQRLVSRVPNAASQQMVKEYVAQYGGSRVRRQRRRGRGLLGGPGDGPGGHRHRRHRQREDHRLPAQRRHAEQRAGSGEVRRAGRERGRGGVRLPVAEGNFSQVLPTGVTGGPSILATKPPWTG